MFKLTPIVTFFSGLADHLQSLEDLSGRLNEFGTYNDDVNNTLKKLEEKLDAHLNLGSSAKDPKYQDKIAVRKTQLFMCLLNSCVMEVDMVAEFRIF